MAKYSIVVALTVLAFVFGVVVVLTTTEQGGSDIAITPVGDITSSTIVEAVEYSASVPFIPNNIGWSLDPDDRFGDNLFLFDGLRRWGTPEPAKTVQADTWTALFWPSKFGDEEGGVVLFVYWDPISGDLARAEIYKGGDLPSCRLDPLALSRAVKDALAE